MKLEKGEHIIEEYDIAIKGESQWRLTLDKLLITNKRLVFEFTKRGKFLKIPMKKIIIHKMISGKHGEKEITVKYFNEKGIQKRIEFTPWDIKKGSIFKGAEIINLSTEVYNLMNNIITRYGIDIQEEVNYCDDCGNKLKKTSKFCKKCGKKIK